ncbi:Intracellular septation protein [Ralstonia mannitolilytica]|jgi:intracellular septation protein|uniref:septation protein A n=1 Tax=Ralstonia mannitolilytica TaxID=105219 RepID=UPI0007AFF710|nr:septation protein A [Ralstonia mannitolilytica]ANA32045.1 septation protein A [Ralstonia mannitolilytica]CAJ0682508.1 Intracellular septation protein [Ralstonia mannitolilytica]CAJ0873923.1 Intracellular septation protein [Ralstonia mannitolilytica]
MKFLFDLFPVILFFAAFLLTDIYTATKVAMAATVVQIAWVWFKHRKVDAMQWLSLLIVMVFGGATLFFHNPIFFKWKLTVLYWLFASVLIVSAVFFRKNLLRPMMEKQLTLPDRVWSQLNTMWSVFFAAVGALNLYIAYSFSDRVWAFFKFFGSMGLMVVFMIVQGVWLAKYIEEPASSSDTQDDR